MTSTSKLYISASLQLFFLVISQYYLQASAYAQLRLSLIIFGLVLVLLFMYEDIQKRGLSKIYLLWALISPLGVVLYHLITARHSKIKS